MAKKVPIKAEESSLVTPNKRRETPSGAFLAARPFFHSAALEIACVCLIHGALSASLNKKMDTGSDYLISVNRP